MHILQVFCCSRSSERERTFDFGTTPGFTKIVNKYETIMKNIKIKKIDFSTIFNNFHKGINNNIDNPTKRLMPIIETHQ